MTYSRSRTNQNKKSKRRSKIKLLLITNGILFGILLIVAAIVWKSYDKQENAGSAATESPKSQALQSPISSSAQVQDPGSEPSLEPSMEPGAGESSPPVEQESDDPTEAEETITLALVGDILPAASVLKLMQDHGYDYPYREARAVLEAADITAGNLESAITTRGTPEKDKQYIFRGPPDVLPAIKEAGFDFLALANNHTLDYGWEGLSDTMDALDDVGLKHAGSGIDDQEAFTPAYIESKGITVGFISVSRVVPWVYWKADRNQPGVAEAYTPTRAIAAIKAAKEVADIVVVMVHWGVEKEERPVEHQTELAHWFVDAGADLVVGAHPHVLQGFESYKGKWIAYSLGNFVFNTTATSRTSETGVLNAECDKAGACSLTFIPMLATKSQPAPMEETAGQELLARLSTLSYGAIVAKDGTIVAADE